MKKLGFIKTKIETMRETKIYENGEETTVGQLSKANVRDLKVENAVLALINTTLAMRAKWYETAKPRVDAFETKYSNVKTLQDLLALMNSMSEKEFCEKVLNFRAHPRYVILREMTEAFIDYQKKNGFSDDWLAMQDWAKKVDLKNLDKDIMGKIKRVGLATVQNLRLICGIDTVKPDVHVKESLKEIGLGNEVEVVELLSELTGYSCAELDQIFWYWDKNRSKKDEITEEEFEKL